MRDNFSLHRASRLRGWAMRPPGILLAALLVGCARLHAQAPAQTPAKAFDIVSIRPSDPNAVAMMTRPGLNRFEMTNVTVKYLIEFAYDLHDFQIVDAPAWTESERFDIVAKMDPVSDEDAKAGIKMDREERFKLVQVRVRALLADRFQLKVHSAVKELPIFELEVAKSGPKLQATKSTKGSSFSEGPGQFKCNDTPTDQLASMLSDELDRIVVDRTKLTGGYDFTLKWTPDGAPVNDTSPPGIFTAIQEQLGLKLTSAKGPVDVIVIDHVARPSDN